MNARLPNGLAPDVVGEAAIIAEGFERNGQARPQAHELGDDVQNADTESRLRCEGYVKREEVPSHHWIKCEYFRAQPIEEVVSNTGQELRVI